MMRECEDLNGRIAPGRKFGFVITVFPGEAAYLFDALSCIVQQEVSRDQIAVVVIDLGDSEEVRSACDLIAGWHPNTVAYSSATSEGYCGVLAGALERIDCRYNAIIDPQLRISENACASIEAIFSSNDVSLCAIPLDAPRIATTNELVEDDRITDVVDLFFEPAKGLESMNGVFFRGDVNVASHYEKAPLCESSFYVVTKLLCEFEEYGLADEAACWYEGVESAAALNESRLSSRSQWRKELLQSCYSRLLEEESQAAGGIAPSYVQCEVFRKLCRRYKENCLTQNLDENRLAQDLDENCLSEYRDAFSRALDSIDDNVIATIGGEFNLYREDRLYLLALKHGMSLDEARRSLTIDADGMTQWIPKGGSPVQFSTASREARLVVTGREGDADCGYLSTVMHSDNVLLTGFPIGGDSPSEAQLSLDSEGIGANVFECGFFHRVLFALKTRGEIERYVLTVNGVELEVAKKVSPEAYYDFAFIIPAYNCEEYVEEAIESVLDQDIGFEDNIQLILVNDGSEDRTGDICKLYSSLYPENIVYIEQENAGASAARLAGLKEARTRYVSFLDADDKWSRDACSCALVFWEKHPDIEVVSARHSIFGRRKGNHPLSYKYDKDKVVDLTKTFDQPQLAMNNVFIKRSAIDEELFDSRLSVSEDFAAINRILLKTLRYGIMSKPTYWYQKRASNDSAIDQSKDSMSWYEDTPKYCYQRLYDESMEMYGNIQRWIQFSIMYDLQWRIKDPHPHPLSDEQKETYRQTIISLLKGVDDDIIMVQRNLTREQKLYAYALKRDISFEEASLSLRYKNNSIVIRSGTQGDAPCWRLSRERIIVIESIVDDGESIRLRGMLRTLFHKTKVRLVANVRGESFEAEVTEKPDRAEDSLVEEECYTPLEFEAEITEKPDLAKDSFFEEGYYTPLGFDLALPPGVAEVSLYLGDSRITPDIQSRWYAPLSFKRDSYAVCGDWLVKAGPREGSISVVWKGADTLAEYEDRYEKSLERDKKGKDAIKYRKFATKHRSGADGDLIWLVSDRTTMAGDSGEALFAYLQKNPIDGVKPFFVLRKDSVDYARMSAIGPVVSYGSELHKKLALVADKVISTAADDFVTNRFGDLRPFVQDLETYDFVFLQHGVIKDDLSAWLKRDSKNIAMFVTSAIREQRSIIDNPRYGYDESVVVCTGLPRHDVLFEVNKGIETQKIVLIAPTWRNDLALDATMESGARPQNPFFEQSDYFKFYNGLIHDGKLIEEARSLGFSLRFLVHPSFAQEAYKFKEGFTQIITEYHYPQEFSAASILVTDYSSVAFDFALLRKPVIYAQMDLEKFYSGHIYSKGYYTYEDDGFGPVCESYEDTVQTIVDTMHDPAMSQKYRDRVEEFFYTPETSRCQEVIDAILEINKRRG